jgi:hypothetical protein
MNEVIVIAYAKCIECGQLRPSDYDLPFFEETDEEYDNYYCGCIGEGFMWGYGL